MPDGERYRDISATVRALLRAVALGPDAVAPLLSGEAEAAEIVRLLAPIATAPGLRMDEPLVNGGRVDVSLTAGGGREWWAVFDLADSHSLVRTVTVVERPAPFAGVPGGFVVVLRGPSSSGKSTLMLALSNLAETPWLHFDEPVIGSLPLRFAVWPDASGPIGEGFFAALPALARAGNQVVTSSGMYAEERFRSALAGIPSLFVRLDCPLEVLVDRQRQRSDRWEGLAEETAAGPDDWTYGLRVDTSAHDPAAATGLVLSHVAAILNHAAEPS